MKLNKVFKKAMLASMTLLMAASLTFTGCSSSTGSDDDNNSNNNSGGNNDPITMALPTLDLKTGYKWNDATSSEGSGESFYDGVFVKLTGQLDPSKLSAGLKCTFTLTGSVTKNFDYVNAEESTNPKLTLQIVDTSAAANYWTMLSKQEVDFVEDANGKVDLKWEFNLDKKPVTKNASEITIFVKLMGDPAYNAANKLTITSEDPVTEPQKPVLEDANFQITTSATAAGAAKLVLKYDVQDDTAEGYSYDETDPNNKKHLYATPNKTTLTDLSIKLTVLKNTATAASEAVEYNYAVPSATINGNQYSKGYELKIDALPNVKLEEGDQVKVEVVSAKCSPIANKNLINTIFVDDSAEANYSTPCVDWGKAVANLFANATEPEGNPNGEDPIALGLSSMDGWGKYDVSDKSATGFTMKSQAAQALNDCCGTDITFGATKKVTFTVTNNANEECWVQVLIKKDGAEGSGGRVTSATIDGVDCGDVTWGANTTIAAGTSKNFVLNLTGTDADKFVFALNSNGDSLTKTSGDVTISNAYRYE
ncbi:hypothetical protein [Treponema sp.]|uniref:hypothetical protein n=1 Tax=Treponema sp. TaxID=166 RepID=UPI00298E2D0A|nr:hypothetical protein [Treponema sp.]MCQ2241777.1 hypothetical protein [Treponema sp.]